MARSRLPNMLIIGARKCGTTSLAYYLDQHPEIQISARKELNYFSDAGWSDRVAWYCSQFDRGVTVSAEASTVYTTFPLATGVPKRVSDMLPDVKLIYLVGDPLERMISHWIMWHTKESDRDPRAINAKEANRSLPEVLKEYENPSNPYVCPSMYATQLEQYLEYFPMSQILVLDQEDLRERRLGTLQSVFSFLEVDNSFTSPEFSRKLNQSDGKRRPGAVYSRVRRVGLAVGVERIPSASSGFRRP
jgi:hypothetical protein